MPPAVWSSSISSEKDMKKVPIVNFRLIDMDTVCYRRQVEHFEYYWGLQKGEFDLTTSLNHIELRSDMAEKMDDMEWAIMPTDATLDAMNALSDFNKTADIGSRKLYTEELPETEYEYEFVPLALLEMGRPTLHIESGSTTKAIRAPYSRMPRIRSRAHPFFVIFRSQNNIYAASSCLPKAKMDRLTWAVYHATHRWVDRPPTEFVEGPNVWKKHRHPLSDDGSVARAQLKTVPSVRPRMELRSARKSTKAHRSPPKTRKTRSSPYDYTQRPRCPRSAAVARTSRSSNSEASDDGVERDLHGWLDVVRREVRRSFRTPEPEDEQLAAYKNEAVRDPTNVLRLALFRPADGLVGQTYPDDHAYFCSNDWAMHKYRTHLWSSEARERATR
ncbi:hypothetical protein BD626DRAFT_568861 [Schizophyllum amplum]|uniref:Uncharacterized protein n=1 Tax=Schizophyllum amplum TaxID=97359 RepID=A0A550CF92_9AGAR|nr:hypothetical protein BD626DRAFT_568861 [Auriculariopsis ampla]